MSGQPIRLMLITTHLHLREQVGRLLEREPRFTLVADVPSGVEAVSQMRHIRPDLILMDVQLPDGDGLTLAKVIRQLLPGGRVVLLVGSAAYRKPALECGVSETVTKSDLSQNLISTLTRVCASA
jgi:two-component system response regulator DesR